MRRLLLPWLLLPVACGSDQDAVLVTVVDVPADADALQATFRLDGVPATEPARWDAPAGGFESTTTFVALLPEGATGLFEVTVVAEEGAACAAALGTASVALPADALQVTLSGAPPAAPALTSPYNGYDTGSPWAAVTGTLRPRIRWVASAGASSYQVQIDDSCTEPYASCAFASPEVDEETAGTDYRPSADLPVSTVPPVGRRYFLRVRACTCTSCGDWSPVRYIDVGRQRSDVNGDGYADMLIGSLGVDVAAGQEDAGAAYLYAGSPTGWPSINLLGVSGAYKGGYLGASGAFVGDADGDGRGDLAIGEYAAPSLDLTVAGAGRVLLYRGITDAAGPSYLYSSEPVTAGYFGVRVAGCDLNGDGYGEVVISGGYEEDDDSERDSGHVYVFSGGTSGFGAPLQLDNPATGAVSALFGIDIDCGGDLNGDGYADLAVGASNQDGRGAVFIYPGGPAGVATTPSRTVAPAEDQVGSSFGASLAIGDLDDDGLGDLVIGAPAWDRGAADEGHVFFHPGSTTGPSLVPARILDCPDNVASAAFGTALAIARDLDRDGIADLVAGADRWSLNGATGAAFVFAGATGGLAEGPTYPLSTPAPQAGARFGLTLSATGDADGDGDSDLLVGDPFLDLTAVDQGRVWLYPGAAPFSIAPTMLWDGAAQAGVWFGAGLPR